MERNSDGKPELLQGHSNSKTRKRPLDETFKDIREHISPAQQRFRPDSVSSRVTDWLEHIHTEVCGTASPFANQDYTAPEMGHPNRKNKDENFPKPDTPSSQYEPESISVTNRSTAVITASSRQRLVEMADYRDLNLKFNKIMLLDPGGGVPIPPLVSEACDMIFKDRGSPEPSPEQLSDIMKILLRYQTRGATEAEVEDCFKEHVFPKEYDSKQYGLKLEARTDFLRAYVPGGNAERRVAVPRPDLAYGYLVSSGEELCFTEPQEIAGMKMDPPMGKVSRHGLAFPFLIAELKATGPCNGNPWVGTNQCLAGSAACLLAIDRLNCLLEQKSKKTRKVDNLAFSIVLDQNYAELFVSWIGDKWNKWKERDEKYYYTQRIFVYALGVPGGFLNQTLGVPGGFLDFRRHVKNILDWGKGTRLQEIQQALDAIGDEDREDNTARAKGREPSPDGNPPKRRCKVL